MSKELADQFERDLSAPDETAERARQARSRGAEFETDWERALGVYRAKANRHPERLVRVSGSDAKLLGQVGSYLDEESSDDSSQDSVSP